MTPLLSFIKLGRMQEFFDKCGVAIVPCDFKIFNKEEAQIFIDKLQSIVDQMEE